MNFRDTHQRLIAHVNARMRNGEVTERALARHLGISQPHVNNVLRGRRKLSLEIADLVLNFFHCSLLDLYADCELKTNLYERVLPEARGQFVPIFKNPIGAGSEWTTAEKPGRYRTPCAVPAIPECLFFARLKMDTRMPAVLCDSDIALLDTSICARLEDCPSAIFALRRGPDTSLRWIRGGFRNLYIADEWSLDRPLEWERLAMREEQRLEFVKARVLWLGSEASLRRS